MAQNLTIYLVRYSVQGTWLYCCTGTAVPYTLHAPYVTYACHGQPYKWYVLASMYIKYIVSVPYTSRQRQYFGVDRYSCVRQSTSMDVVGWPTTSGFAMPCT